MDMFSLYLNKVYERAIIDTKTYEYDISGLYTFTYSATGFTLRLDTKDQQLINVLLEKRLYGTVIFEDFSLEFNDCRAEISNGELCYFFDCDFVVDPQGCKYELPYGEQEIKQIANIVYKLKMVRSA